MLVRKTFMILFAARIFTKTTVRGLVVPKLAINGLWETQWNEIEAMRKLQPAAVDTMGADALARLNGASAKPFRFQTLIATMLSPQTRDQQTMMAFNNLIKLIAPAPFLASSLLKHDLEAIEKAIQPVSFYKTKAKNIVDASEKCVREHADDIPEKFDDLLAFKGVGPKIAYLTFTIARGETHGICVDTHVHRISNRLGWVNTWGAKSNGPEKTRIQLEALLPKDKWENVNGLLVGFGQTICDAKKPKCSTCNLRTSCKFYNEKSHMR